MELRPQYITTSPARVLANAGHVQITMWCCPPALHPCTWRSSGRQKLRHISANMLQYLRVIPVVVSYPVHPTTPRTKSRRLEERCHMANGMLLLNGTRIISNKELRPDPFSISSIVGSQVPCVGKALALLDMATLLYSRQVVTYS